MNKKNQLKTSISSRNGNDVLEHFRVTRVIYGISSSSFHSIRTLFEAASVNFDKIASLIIERTIYADDLVTGADSVSEGIEVFFQMSRKTMFRNSEVVVELNGGS